MDKISKKFLREGIKYAKKHPRTTKVDIKLKNTQRMVRSAWRPDGQDKRRGRPLDSEARTEAVRQFREAYNKLKARMKRIEKRFGTSPALEEYKSRGLGNASTKGKSIEDIAKMRDNVEYISGLKTSTVKGVEAYEQSIAPLLELYNSNRDVYDKIMYIYNRMVEENQILEKFKYEVLDMIADLSMREVSVKEIYEVAEQFYRDLYESSVSGEKLTKDYNYVLVSGK